MSAIAAREQCGHTMAKKKGLDAEIDKVLRIMEANPETPADVAVHLLNQARISGDGSLRQKYLRKAQKVIAEIDPREEAERLQELQAQVLALQGRGGDTEIAHVTPGELVIPKRMRTPELMAALAQAARQAGIDPRRLVVGDRRNAVNPRTGQAEFAEPMPPLQSLAGFRPNLEGPPVTGADLGPIAQAMGLGGPDGPNTYRGDASYYTRGTITANGEPFDPDGVSAAMPSRANLGGTATVQMQQPPYTTITVPVNDRGPFKMDANGHALQPLQPHPSRVIDLSRGAFQNLVGSTDAGKVPVVVNVTPKKRTP